MTSLFHGNQKKTVEFYDQVNDDDDDLKSQIWNHNNKLVRTLVLNTIPSAITFGNHEGDILLSIKSEIRVVKFKTYLPEEYLKHMIGVQYPIEVS